MMDQVRGQRLTKLKRALAIAERRLNLAIRMGWAHAIDERKYRIGYYQRRIALLEGLEADDRAKRGRLN